MAISTSDARRTGRHAAGGDVGVGWPQRLRCRTWPLVEPADRGWLPSIQPTPTSPGSQAISPNELAVEGAVDRPVAIVRICDVLRAWRTAERELAAAPEGSPARVRIEAELLDLRSLHHRLFDERIRSLGHEATVQID